VAAATRLCFGCRARALALRLLATEQYRRGARPRMHARYRGGPRTHGKNHRGPRTHGRYRGGPRTHARYRGGLRTHARYRGGLQSRSGCVHIHTAAVAQFRHDWISAGYSALVASHDCRGDLLLNFFGRGRNCDSCVLAMPAAGINVEASQGATDSNSI